MSISSLVILTGAGVSKESGLDTFRDADGLWTKVRIEDVATPEAFARDPGRVQDFYNTRRRNLMRPEIVPNAAHRALAALERAWPDEFLLVTQNIDDLHERAGSEKLIHMHGELMKARCTQCGAIRRVAADLTPETICPDCHMIGAMRPHVVWFGEMPLDMDLVYETLAQCGLFAAIGTSGSVYPAAGFVEEARRQGAHTIELNLEPSEGASFFAERHYGPATEIVPAFVERLLADAAR